MKCKVIHSPTNRPSLMRSSSILLILSVLFLGSALAAEETCTEDGVCTNDDDGESNADCVDKHDQCEHWAGLEECENNPTYMYDNCVKACDLCDLTPGQRRKKQAKLKEAKEAPADVTETPYGVEQNVNPGAKDEEALKKIVQNVTNYMDEIVFKDPGHAKVKNDCKNRCVVPWDCDLLKLRLLFSHTSCLLYRNANCAFWALSGECDAVSANVKLSSKVVSGVKIYCTS
jgi:hypothetical protein